MSKLVTSPAGNHGTFLIVAVGASAGGLDACKKLLDALPRDSGMAFILVQHLDPNHESMLVELLASHTSMQVMQAVDGTVIEPDHLYVIAPGTNLSVSHGALQVLSPKTSHGLRLPFDFLLHSLAEDFGARAACVILSGTGTDGSLGLTSIKRHSGLVLVQAPGDAGYAGMPSSAIDTGGVDDVLPATGIAAALLARRDELMRFSGTGLPARPANVASCLPLIIDLLRERTAHDYTLYKQGTMRRRVEHRMALAGIGRVDMPRYLEMLQTDAQELELLAKDLLINVTSFFRDEKVFAYLAEKLIPDLVRTHAHDQPLRVWCAGCSTGEEAYSLAMLFHEQIAVEKRNIRLQVFASDADADAIAIARDGLYAESITADVSAARLARFFSREGNGYKVSPELRTSVVFTVQDLLVDPPFSRLDFISCRNVLIYLGPEAQEQVIALFHFALRERGILLLGTAETVGGVDGRFEVVAKPERIYRAIGRSRLLGIGNGRSASFAAHTPNRAAQTPTQSQQAALANLCQRLVLENHSPAAVLVNARHECLYSSGPTYRYLRLAQGHPTQDVLAMVQGPMRTRLRSAIHRAAETASSVIVAGGQYDRNGVPVGFDLDVQSVAADGEHLFLICFVDRLPDTLARGEHTSLDNARVSELERDLETTRTELETAIKDHDTSVEEQRAVNEEALSVNEEFQSTNEELLTSKEELQSLNEELNALNTQLQETLDRQRTTSDDLQNILYSTDVATLFLDAALHIRFFTPATRSLFNFIPSDIGRPLADLSSLSGDTALGADAGAVLSSLLPMEREIETRPGIWFIRRILPYRTNNGKVEGVVITFADITERKAIRKALELAKQQAELANVAKSRFLAAASHDLRQPLQTLTLLQSLLTRLVEGEKATTLVTRFGDTLEAMTGMLNTLLDINQIEAGIVRAEPKCFAINDVLDRLRAEFAYHTQAQNLDLRVVPCSLTVHSDPRLLEQMIRNLLSNALKYTRDGKVLVGCRRRKGVVSIEIWDTGIGIPPDQLNAIFEEYHQLDNEARVRDRGLGLGLSIVKRLAALLSHRIHVRSHLGKGSVFAIEVTVPGDAQTAVPKPAQQVAEIPLAPARCGTILLVEDDPDVRELVEMLLEAEGLSVLAAADGPTALSIVDAGQLKPDLLLADFNLPNGMHGLQLAAQLRAKLNPWLPVIIMTGDISAATMREIDAQHCVQLNKPVNFRELLQTIQPLIAQLSKPTATTPLESAPPSVSTPSQTSTADTVYVLDDDKGIREAFRAVLEGAGHHVETFATCEEFLAGYNPGQAGCLLVDGYLPGMSGLDLLHRLRDGHTRLVSIMITGNGDVPMAVEAMKTGASNFIEKPVKGDELLAAVQRSLEQSHDESKALAWQTEAANSISGLTARQREIMDLILAGQPNKNIAADLGISQRTVENHRALIMKKTGSRSLPALARLALAGASKARP